MNSQKEILDIIKKMDIYIEKCEYRGYDPYDALTSPLKLQRFGKYIPLLTMQALKRLPINVRPLLGIKKDYNPKGLGLLLLSYCNLYEKLGERKYEEKCHHLFNIICKLNSPNYKGIGWGYNFPWSSSEKYLEPYTPSSVVTGFIIRGILKYALVFDSPAARSVIHDAAEFIDNHIPLIEDDTGICFSYTPVQTDICYNASLLAAEILAASYFFSKCEEKRKKIQKAIEFVVHRQLDNGCWHYSENIKQKTVRKQIDFHQGYIIDSIQNLISLCELQSQEFDKAIQRGVQFYAREQFEEDGKPMYRLPKRYPVDVHNLSQGIISLNKFKRHSPEIPPTLSKVVQWGIKHMFSDRGYFYYRKNKLFTNKIAYMRWSQAWMFLALSEIIE